MQVSSHPPLFLVPRPGEGILEGGVALAHATVWTHLVVPEWRESWEVHLQLVGVEGESGCNWRAVDLTRRPLSPSPPRGLRSPRELELAPRTLAALTRWLEQYRVHVFRSPETGLVSRPGEDMDGFRRRVLAAARPVVLAAKESGGGALEAAAEVLRTMSASLERRELPLAGSKMWVRAGLLVVPSLECLPPAGPAPDPMLRGPVRCG